MKKSANSREERVEVVEPDQTAAADDEENTGDDDGAFFP